MKTNELESVRGPMFSGDAERLEGLIDRAVLADDVGPGKGYHPAGAPVADTPVAGASVTGASAQRASATAANGEGRDAETTSDKPGSAQGLNPLAAAISLMLASPAHRHLFIADLEWRLLPAIAARQFRLIVKDERPLAFVTWAFVSDEVKARLTSESGPSGAGRLKPEEWRSGRNHVIVDFVSPFVTDEVERKRMLASVFGVGKQKATVE
jgi:cytolysin-activating lysine-acyltransferase